MAHSLKNHSFTNIENLKAAILRWHQENRDSESPDANIKGWTAESSSDPNNENIVIYSVEGKADVFTDYIYRTIYYRINTKDLTIEIDDSRGWN